MIGIKEMCPGQFGNKIMHYNNLRQLAYFLGQDFWCAPFNGSDIFIDIENTPEIDITNAFYLTYDIAKEIGKKGILNIAIQNKLILLKTILGEMFFWFDELSTSEIFRLKKSPELGPGVHVAAHFRGTDFHQWDIKAILCQDYYLKGIEKCLSHFKGPITFHLFTDDFSLNSYHKSIEFLIAENIPFLTGKIAHPYEDFSIMSECDVIISSPSTFAIAAGFIGKNKKKIIHSMEWIEYKKNDPFWRSLSEGGNNNYKLWETL